MTTQVAFLRAVNLGKRRVPMARLVQVCTAIGHGTAWTYVNSGNVVFDATGGRALLERGLEKAAQEEFGFECTTFVRTASELRKVLQQKPFPVTSGDTHFVTFLKDTPSAPVVTSLEALSNDFDTLVVVGRDVHSRMRGKSSDSKLVKRDWEKLLGSNSSTSRNMTMLTKLVAKMDA